MKVNSTRRALTELQLANRDGRATLILLKAVQRRSFIKLMGRPPQDDAELQSVGEGLVVLWRYLLT